MIRARGRPKNRDAFTIVEMVVVMAILGVMAAVAVPAFRTWIEEDDMTNATQRVEVLFRLARDSAVKTGSTVTVWIDSASSGVWFVSSADSMVQTALMNTATGAQRTPGEAIGLPESVQMEIAKTRARFLFAPSGAVFADTLTLRGTQETRVITLHPWTGDVIY